MLEEHSVVFGRPDCSSLRKEGWNPADMHFHTNHSDSFSSVKSILKLASERNTGLAITDHNLIKGVEEAFELKKDQFVIPGIEISSWDGPHILVYFYELGDLRNYWGQYVKPYMSKSPWLSINRTVEEILDSLDGVSCVVSAAHPMGYAMEYRGIQQGVEKGKLSADTAKRFDAYEVIGGTMMRHQNVRCRKAADSFGLSYTGGTDGHLLHQLGNIVTCTRSDSIEGFLDEVKNGRSSVVGTEAFIHTKLLHSITALTNFVGYIPSSIALRYRHLVGKR